MKTKKYNRTIGVWLLAGILVLLILLSFALLASALKGLTTGERDVIALTPEEAPDGFFSSAFYQQAKEDPELNASDDKVSWETNTDVDLFKTAYLDPEGKLITVQSGDDTKVIAPGTTNDYRFSLKNTGNVSLDYTLGLEGTFELSDKKLPFEVRLKRGNDWVVGTEDTWSTIDELNEAVEKDTLAVGKYVIYTLEWQWPYEFGQDDMLFLNDINDTAIGDAAAEMNANFHLTITTTSEVTPGAVAMDENGNLLYEEKVNPKNLAMAVSMFAAGLLGLLLLLLWKNRIYVTGLLPEYAGSSMHWKRKESVLLADGRFVFEHLPFTDHTFIFQNPDGTKVNELIWRLKRDRHTEGLHFETRQDKVIVFAGKGIRAIELYLTASGESIIIETARWAAIDKKQNVFSPEGKKEPDENGRNETAAGLIVDEHGRFAVKEKSRD